MLLSSSRAVDRARARRRWLVAVVLAPLLWLGAVPASATPGFLDTTFGIGGVVRTDLGGTYDWAYAAVIQPDGCILAAGVSDARGTYDFAVARYTRAQRLDPTFGTDGVVITDFDGGFDWAYAMVLQPDGKFLVAGVSKVRGRQRLALARYHPDGSLDASFGDGGRVIERRQPLTGDIGRAVALQPDGRIFVAGVAVDDRVSLNPQGDFVVARYLPDGRPDLTFGVGGIATTDFDHGSYDGANALALQPDGRIVLAGYTNRRAPGALFGADDLALARYTLEGLLDRSFGDGGKVVVDGGTLSEAINALAITPDGGILAAGFVNGEKRGDLLLARFGPDGALVSGWGNTRTGLAVNDLGTNSERLAAVVLQPDGAIVAGGQTAVSDNADFAVFRYDSRGLLDPTFGKGGVATVDFDGREDRVHTVVLQSDGEIVAVGQSEADFALARFHGR